MHQPTGTIAVPHPVIELNGLLALCGAHGLGVPLGLITVVIGHESGFTALSQTHIELGQALVHLMPQIHDALPLLLGVGFGHPRRFPDALDAHLMLEFDLAVLHHAGYGRGRRRIRAAGQRNVTFPGKQARRGIQSHPTGAGQEDLAPGVQVSEVFLRARGAIQCFQVRLELNQVTGDEPRCQPKVPKRLDQQPGGVPTGSGAFFQGLFRRLHARLHPDQIINPVG